jgi:hypothetical protein
VGEIQHHLNALEAAQAVINDRGKSLKVKLAQCDVATSSTSRLAEFAALGIPIGKNDYPAMLENVQRVRDQVVSVEADAIIEKAKLQSGAAATVSGKSSAFRSALSKLFELQRLVTDESLIQSRIQTVQFENNKIQINGIVEKARRSEFKGEWEQALEQYQDALFHVKNDPVDDFFQSGVIHELEHKIAEISAKLKPGQ